MLFIFSPGSQGLSFSPTHFRASTRSGVFSTSFTDYSFSPQLRGLNCHRMVFLRNGQLFAWGGVTRRARKEIPLLFRTASFLHFSLDTQNSSDPACPCAVRGAILNVGTISASHRVKQIFIKTSPVFGDGNQVPGR